MDKSDTSVPLIKYVERIFTERERALKKEFKSQNLARKIAAKRIEERLLKLNELRQEVTQDRATLITRDKYEADQKTLYTRIDAALTDMKQWQDRADGALNIVRWLSVGGAGALILEVARLFGQIK